MFLKISFSFDACQKLYFKHKLGNEADVIFAVSSLQSANVDITLSLGVLVLVSLQSENIKHQTLINIDRK